jgi:hypothetical protein
VHEGGHPDRRAVADLGAVGLEGAVLRRVALDRRPGVERDGVAERGERVLGDGAAVVEEPPADPDPQRPQTSAFIGVPAEINRNRGSSFPSRS